MNQDLLTLDEALGDEVGIQVPQEKQELKEQYASSPYGQTPAKPGQDILSDQGLYLKEEKRAQGDGQYIEKHTVSLSRPAVPAMEAR